MTHTWCKITAPNSITPGSRLLALVASSRDFDKDSILKKNHHQTFLKQLHFSCLIFFTNKLYKYDVNFTLLCNIPYKKRCKISSAIHGVVAESPQIINIILHIFT